MIRLLAPFPMCAALAACQQAAEPPVAPPGRSETATTNALEAGAALLQNNGPLAKLDIHLVGFHPMKDAPQHQMRAHHFCRQVNEDFAQCALFDGAGQDANLNGVEYIISESLFLTLPPEERVYWHPHNGEILSGQLIAPGIPQAAEQALMRRKINSYGKTWHTWHSTQGAAPGNPLPTGPAMLAWSFSRDGELDPALARHAEQQLGFSMRERREARRELSALARPQQGVDALKGRFTRPTTSIPGVVDATAVPPQAPDGQDAATGP